MIVNLRESLNTRDRKSVNGNSKYYDLVNLYESCNLSADNKKTLAKMINNNASDKAIYSFLYECYEGKEDIKEDTVKKDGKWVNKGKEGTHGEFKTKKAADAQRKAMFANGYKGESLKESTSIYRDYNGIMGNPGATWTIKELKAYWETNHNSDPVLNEYKSMQSWLNDTIAMLHPVTNDEYDESLKESSDSFDCDEIQTYSVVRVGGSVGEKSFFVVKSGLSKEEANEYAKVRMKSLSPGEKKYYGIKYKVVPDEKKSPAVSSVEESLKAKNQNEAEEILYVIKDSHGNQLSKPNADDSELWDRVASMEARGRRGLRVVVYTGKKESLAEDKGQPRSNRYTTYFNRIKRAIEKGDEETLKRTKEAIMYAPAKELKNSEASELMNMIKNRKITESVSGKYGEVKYEPRRDGMSGESAVYANYHLFSNDGKYTPYWAGERPMGSSYNSVEDAVKGIDAFIDRQRKDGKMLYMKPVNASKSIKEAMNDPRYYKMVEYDYDGDSASNYLGHVRVRTNSDEVALRAAEKYAMSKHPEDNPGHFKIVDDNYTNVDVVDSDGDYLTTLESLESEDGWSEEIIDIVDPFFVEVETVAYELRNTVRGAYRFGTTVEDLVQVFRGFSETADDIANELDDNQEHLEEDWRTGTFTRDDLTSYRAEMKKRVEGVAFSIKGMKEKHPEYYEIFDNLTAELVDILSSSYMNESLKESEDYYDYPKYSKTLYLPSIRQGKVKLTIGTFSDPRYDDEHMFEILAIVDVEARRDDFTLDSEKLYKKLNIRDGHEKLSGYDDRYDNLEGIVDEIYDYFMTLDQDDIDDTLIELADDFDVNRVNQMFGPIDMDLFESLFRENKKLSRICVGNNCTDEHDLFPEEKYFTIVVTRSDDGEDEIIDDVTKEIADKYIDDLKRDNNEFFSHAKVLDHNGKVVNSWEYLEEAAKSKKSSSIKDRLKKLIPDLDI